MSILVVTFLVESQIGYIADFIPGWLVSNEGMTLFIGSVVVFAVGGILLLRYLNNIVQNRRAPIHIGVTVAYYVQIAIVAFIVAQILVTQQYNTIEIAALIVITYGLWIAILSLLSVKFVSWIRATGKKKTNLVVLVLALSMIAYVVSEVAGLANHLLVLQLQQKEVVTSADVAFFPEFDPESQQEQVNLVYQIAVAILLMC